MRRYFPLAAGRGLSSPHHRIIGMKPLHRSAILIGGLIVLVLLLGLGVDSFFWRIRFRGDPPSRLVELRSGVLSRVWIKAPDWLGGAYPDPAWSRTRNRTASPAGLPPTHSYGILEVTRLQLPIWQLITLHFVLCWSAIILRQRRKWERLQAAGNPELLETS